jgi:AbrB family looped-hinge helix DNA binding protein
MYYPYLEGDCLFESVCVVGERGQITLPKVIRDINGIKNKDKILVKMENNKVILHKLQSKKETERLLKEYYQKYGHLEEKINKEWEHVSKEADAMLDDN